MNRRNWIKRSAGAGMLSLLGAPALGAGYSFANDQRFHPRPLAKPIQLNFNENPFGPSETMRSAMKDAFELGCRYPSSYVSELMSQLAEKEGVSEDHIVVVGGSTEGLKVTGLTYANNGGEIIAGRPTFLAMLNYARQWGATINWVDVNQDKVLDVDEMEKRISDKTKLIFLCNPNNPTSTLLPKDKLVDFCSTAAKKTMVFSDEAYYDFIKTPDYPSMVDLVKKGENVIVSRTFSKVYGLAGLRIGYLIAKPSIAREIRKNVVAFTNILAIKAASAALKDQEFYDFSLRNVNKCKELMEQTMDGLELTYLPSHTNFLFFKSGMNISQFGKAMEKEGIKVGRPFPPFTDWCRISTGTIEEVQLFNQALTRVLG